MLIEVERISHLLHDMSYRSVFLEGCAFHIHVCEILLRSRRILFRPLSDPVFFNVSDLTKSHAIKFQRKNAAHRSLLYCISP